MTGDRSGLGACPACQQPLREHAERVVCDSCQGMLVTAHELATSLYEVGGGTATDLEARDVEPASAACPRCASPMERCSLRLGTQDLKGRFLRCQTDGVWLSQGQFVEELARGGRRGHAGGGGLTSTAAAYMSVAPKGGAAAAMAGIGQAFTQNQRTPIGYQAPRVRIAFVSAFKGHELACPTCTTPLVFRGDQWVCSTCAGVFVENAALVAMVQEITGAPWELPRPTATASPRTCPACRGAMTMEKHGTVEIDRCAADGMWFDERELAALLLDTAQPTSTGGWLRRLFG